MQYYLNLISMQKARFHIFVEVNPKNDPAEIRRQFFSQPYEVSISHSIMMGLCEYGKIHTPTV